MMTTVALDDVLLAYEVLVVVVVAVLLLRRGLREGLRPLGLLAGSVALGVPAVLVKGQVVLVVLGVVVTLLLTACFVTRGDVGRFLADSSESDEVNETQKRVLMWAVIPMCLFFYVFRSLAS